ncbi:MAG: hypothetical protein JW783_15940 [Bacteroidales bacterium]|nr:hypothetical protein [Bacteroidales bacterium]MBN2750629.1 hypothetical protein [Bacteroidales bacterium]
MNKYLSATIGFLFTVLVGFSQTGKSVVVRLNDGSYIHGTIVSQTADSLQVIAAEPLPNNQLVVTKRPKDKGMFTSISLSILSGKENSISNDGVSLKVVNAYQTSSGVSYGVGVGIENLGPTLLPIFATLQYFPLNTKLSPYVLLRAGYGFSLSNSEVTHSVPYYYGRPTSTNTRGGVMLSASVGLASFVFKKSALTVSVGYQYQHAVTNETYTIWGATQNQKAYRELSHNFNRMEVQFGFLFK